MKKQLLTLLSVILFASFVNAQDSTVIKQFMKITSVESLYAAYGDSRLIITNADGTQEEVVLESLFTMVGGTKIKSIKSNELKITLALKRYTDKGWKLELTAPFPVNPGHGSNGALITRYMLSREQK